MEDQSIQSKTSQGPNSSKWVTILIIIIVALIFIDLAAWGAYKYFYQKSDPEPIACTLEAKVCPDGSSVGRVAPDCEFTECPEVTGLISDWQTYRNEEYGFELEYPENWFMEDCGDGNIPFDDSLKLLENVCLCSGDVPCYAGRIYINIDDKDAISISERNQLINALIEDAKYEETSIDIGGIAAIRVSKMYDPNISYADYVFFQKGGYLFYIGYQELEAPKYLDSFEYMISTFSFLE